VHDLSCQWKISMASVPCLRFGRSLARVPTIFVPRSLARGHTRPAQLHVKSHVPPRVMCDSVNVRQESRYMVSCTKQRLLAPLPGIQRCSCAVSAICRLKQVLADWYALPGGGLFSMRSHVSLSTISHVSLSTISHGAKQRLSHAFTW
jgi:hypothetical protein